MPARNKYRNSTVFLISKYIPGVQCACGKLKNTLLTSFNLTNVRVVAAVHVAFRAPFQPSRVSKSPPFVVVQPTMRRMPRK